MWAKPCRPGVQLAGTGSGSTRSGPSVSVSSVSVVVRFSSRHPNYSRAKPQSQIASPDGDGYVHPWDNIPVMHNPRRDGCRCRHVSGPATLLLLAGGLGAAMSGPKTERKLSGLPDTASASATWRPPTKPGAEKERLLKARATVFWRPNRQWPGFRDGGVTENPVPGVLWHDTTPGHVSCVRDRRGSVGVLDDRASSEPRRARPRLAGDTPEQAWGSGVVESVSEYGGCYVTLGKGPGMPWDATAGMVGQSDARRLRGAWMGNGAGGSMNFSTWPR